MTSAVMLPPVATTARGAPGTVGIITASEGSESELVWVSWPKQNPRKLAVQTRSLALTVKVYRSPAVSPVTVHVSEVVVQVVVVVPSVTLTV